MSKFSGLVKNEYVKTLRRVSTKIMLVLVILAGIGMSALGLIVKKTMSYEGGYHYDYSYEIDDLKDNKPEGYEYDIKFYEFLEKSELDYDDYKYNLAYDINMILSGELMLENLNKIEDESKWREICTALLDNTTDESRKWEFEYRLENDIAFSNANIDKLIAKITNLKSHLAVIGDSASDEEYANQLKDDLMVCNYMIENNIEINTADNTSLLSAISASDVNFWKVFYQSKSLVQIIGLLIIVIAGNSVASEFTQGTIKFLLINPVKRWKILASKYFTVISIGYIMLALLYVVVAIAGGLFVGFDNLGASYIYVSDGVVHSIPGFLHVAQNYLLNSVSIIVMATLAFAVSSLLKSAAFSIGISVFMMLAGNTIITLLSLLKQDWGRYLIFSNLNLSNIVEGNASFPYQTIAFAVTAIVLHMFVFILTAWDGFVKKEV